MPAFCPDLSGCLLTLILIVNFWLTILLLDYGQMKDLSLSLSLLSCSCLVLGNLLFLFVFVSVIGHVPPWNSWWAFHRIQLRAATEHCPKFSCNGQSHSTLQVATTIWWRVMRRLGVHTCYSQFTYEVFQLPQYRTLDTTHFHLKSHVFRTKLSCRSGATSSCASGSQSSAITIWPWGTPTY
jgi:hypothetical protein